MVPELDPQKYYRLPWSLTDNAVSWLEVTTKCNLACEGCYRDPQKDGHKSLKEIAEDLAVFKKKRKSDCISIAGGDPLVHPEIVEIVRMIKKEGWKPIVNTNGLALTESLLHDLKKAGAFGFTFHIDTSQKRKDSPASKETDHNKLRQKFADMLAKEGGMCSAFNQTVTTDTIEEIPAIIEWAKKYPDTVHTVVFILYRDPNLMGDFDYFANGKKIEIGPTYKETVTWGGKKRLKAKDAVHKIREAEPTYEPNCYLNGTVDPNSLKWLLGTRIGTKDQTYGYVSPTFMEKTQQVHHLFCGTWLSYAGPGSLKVGRSSMLLGALVDKGMRQVAKSYLKQMLRNPLNLAKRAYLQTFMVIQPVDMCADGRMDMCDGCPDITAHKGELYWSCRLEEIKEYDAFITASPKKQLKIASERAETSKEKPSESTVPLQL